MEALLTELGTAWDKSVDIASLGILIVIAKRVGAYEEFKKWTESELKLVRSRIHDIANQVSTIAGRVQGHIESNKD